MPRYCPAGDGAFEDWVERCPECGRSLRDQPPDDPPLGEDSPGEIVWLTTAPNEPIAQMWAEDLRGEEIPVLVRPGGPGFAAWGSVATFEHHLYVRQLDVPRARALLTELDEWNDEAVPPSGA